jgi:hypothetical protein
VAQFVPLPDATALGVTCTYRNVCLIALNGGNHFRQSHLIMLKITVHNGKDWSRRGQHAFDYGT